MRGFPLGIFYPSDVVYDISIACSRLTHYDPVAGHCSAWLTMMASDMCRGVPRKQAFAHARSRCRSAEVLAVLGNYEQHHPEPSLDAVECSHAALFCFMTAHTFENALLSAINLGGDSDTVGACCGALAGSSWGIDAAPERWTKILDGFNEIVHLADMLWQVRQDKRVEGTDR